MLVKCLAAYTHLSFPSNSTRKFILAQFGVPWDNDGKFYMDGKRIRCWSNETQHIPIYLQPFTSYSKILVGNCNIFLPPLHLTSPLGRLGVFPFVGCSHWNSWKKFGPQKTRIMGLSGSEYSLTIG